MTGRVALVTGAGRGIGRATAARLAADGARVVTVARTEAELRDVAAETGAQWIAADLADRREIARVVAEATAQVGPVEVLVNNAGVGSAGEQPVERQDPLRWQAALDLNVTAPFELTRLVLPGMLARGWGRVVMVGSLASRPDGVGPGMSAYAASKHALLGLARVVALEAGARGVTCNSVLPGSVRTRTARGKVAEEAAAAGITPEEMWEVRARRSSSGRLVAAEEVAAAIAFLCGEEASGINGAALTVSA